MPGDWTGNELDTIRRLWAEGLSIAKIADRLPGRTKNAVVGKIHRLVLPSRPSPIRRQAPAATPPAPAGARPAPLPRAAATLPPPPAAPPPSPPPAPLPPPRLSTRKCCWPIGEPRQPGFRICEAPVEIGARLAYCPEHHARAISPRLAKPA